MGHKLLKQRKFYFFSYFVDFRYNLERKVITKHLPIQLIQSWVSYGLIFHFGRIDPFLSLIPGFYVRVHFFTSQTTGLFTL